MIQVALAHLFHLVGAALPFSMIVPRLDPRDLGVKHGNVVAEAEGTVAQGIILTIRGSWDKAAQVC